MSLAVIGSCAWGMDLPGAGESPGVLPANWWFGWGNDYLGNAPPINGDDFRTNRFMGGFHAGEWTFAGDWSNLTTTNPTGSYPAFGTDDPFIPVDRDAQRSDELTLSATRDWSGGGAIAWRLAGGPGIRIAGDLGGEWLQERVHTETASPSVILPYDTDVPFALAAVARAGAEWPRGSALALLIDAAAIGTTAGEVQAETAVRAVWRGPGGAVWLGWRQALRGGSNMSETAAIVADHERGSWMVAGIEAPAVAFTFGANPGTDAVEGTVQIRAAEARPAYPGLPVEAELGVVAKGPRTDDGNGYDLRVRCGLPEPETWFTRVLRAALTIRRIERTTGSIWDMMGQTYQFIGSVQVDAWPTPASGPVAVPYAGAGGGWHHAEVRAIGPAGFTEGGSLDTAVADAEIGLRLGWSAPTWRSGAAIAWEWQRFADAETVDWAGGGKAGSIELAEPGASIVLRWWVAVSW